MKVLICGGRHWKDRRMIRDCMRSLPAGTTVIHGAARGADKIAGEVAGDLGLKVMAFPADWQRLGKAAGPVRNLLMLEQNPDEVWAFHDNLAESRGTKNMLSLATKKGVQTRIFSHLSEKAK